MTEIRRIDRYRSCLICCSKQDPIYGVMFRNEVTGSGTEITICDKCIDKMFKTCVEIGIIDKEEIDHA